MGKDLADHFSAARDVFTEVDDVLEQLISKKMFHGTQEDLSQTEVTQPALLAHSVAAYRVAQAECGLSVVSPSACAVLGHSVGEYAALVIAGSMTLADAARLLQLRGRSMQAAADAEVQRLARRAGGAAKAVVLSGHTEAVQRAVVLLRAGGSDRSGVAVKRAVPLPVSAPFHCPLMQGAADAVGRALGETPAGATAGVVGRGGTGSTGGLLVHLVSPPVPLVCGASGTPVSHPAALREALVTGITAPVLWADAVSSVAGLRVGGGQPGWVELGTGATLCGLVKQCVGSSGGGGGPPAVLLSMGTPKDLKPLREALRRGAPT